MLHPNDPMQTPAAAASATARPAAAPMSRENMAAPILLQYYQVVLRWRWVIASIIAAALLFGLIATLLTTPQFTAKSRIEISRDQKNITKVDGLDARDAGRDLEFYQTQYALLASRTLAERVVRDQKLADGAEFFEAHGTAPPSPDIAGATGLQASSAGRTRREKQAADLLLRHIGISPVRGSSLIDVTYSSASRELSTRIANSWVKQFIAASIDRRFSSTVDARTFLEKQLTDLRAKLEQSERDLVNYATEKSIVTLSKTQGADGKTQTERTLASSNLEALNDALSKATADRIAAQSRSASGGDGASSESLSNATISTLRQRRAEIASEYAKLMVQFEPGYPAARALDQQVRTLDAAIAREEQRVTGARSAEYSEAAKRERVLGEQVAGLKSRLDVQQRDSIQYNIYQREVDTNRQLYDALLQRYKEIGVAGVDANNISIVDPARQPEEPSAPNLLLNMALALLVGLALAAAATFVLDQIDEGVRDPEQIGRQLGIPLLGGVPDVDGDPRVMLNDTKSVVSEAYLSIRSNLAFSTDHGVPRTIMVTSTRPAEGKSTTSLAIATVLHRTGQTVLLIDGDMRSPSMHDLLGVKNTAGLSNVLAGEDDWQKLLVKAPATGLSFMTAGPTPPNAAELLSSNRIGLLVRQALEEFDHVIVDSPPILGLADAPLLARAVEGCVFVIEAEGVPIRGIKSALSRLQAVQAHIFGAVLTKVAQRHSGYGYGYGYGYSYGQGEDEKRTA